MMEKGIEIKIAKSEEEFKLFWQLHNEYMNRDIFPNDEIGLKMTEEEQEWFSSSEYKEHMHKLFSRNVDTAYPIFFIKEKEIIGFCTYCTYHSEDGKCFIIDYCIIPEFRDNGLGTKIFNIIKEMEVSKGAKYLELNVSNKKNMKFWMKRGFRFDGIDDYGVIRLTTKRNSTYLIDIDESNWTKLITLELSEDQKAHVASPMGILARAYVYRNYNGRVFGIESEENIIGMLMIRDINEEPKCYELQQFLIDSRYQNRGYGYKSLKLILDYLYVERRYENVEVCVRKKYIKAINLYKKIGFKDTGYTDPNVEDAFNLVFSFNDLDNKVQSNREFVMG
ncbi:GNAT family N-acetyltransferase [Clostridium sp. Cult2]|uniref:GNAT family N-acetyltransferase n=1 Tax=Clostridium sp. Cult2 TaxID=2079003 RepID=UPI001F466C87|nr:GNAT family N-acetyltransferase [Clostridium sp. Cult2]